MYCYINFDSNHLNFDLYFDEIDLIYIFYLNQNSNFDINL